MSEARQRLTEAIALAKTRVSSLLAGEHGALSAPVERELQAVKRHLVTALATHVAREMERAP